MSQDPKKLYEQYLKAVSKHTNKVGAVDTTDVQSPSMPKFSEGGQAKLGSGERFAKLKEELSHQKGIKDPGALAASIGRKKYGNKKMNKIAKAHMADGGEVQNSELPVNGDDVKTVQGLGIIDRFNMVRQGLDPSNPDHIRKFKASQNGMVDGGKVENPEISKTDEEKAKEEQDAKDLTDNTGYAEEDADAQKVADESPEAEINDELEESPEEDKSENESDTRQLPEDTLTAKEALSENPQMVAQNQMDPAAGLQTTSAIQRLINATKQPGMDLKEAQNQRDQNIAGQQMSRGAALIAAGMTRQNPNTYQDIVSANDKYVNMPVQKYEENISNQQNDPNSNMSQVVRDYIKSKGLTVPENSSASDLFKVAPFLLKDQTLQMQLNKVIYQQSQMNQRSAQNLEARSKESNLNRENSTKNAQIRADAITAGQGKADARQDQRLSGQIVQRIHQDPVIKPSEQNMASLQKSAMILDNKSVPLTPQLLSDAEQDIASGLTIRGMGGSEGKIKRSELITVGRQIAEAKQKYLNRPDIDLREEEPELVATISKINKALHDDYDQTIKDRKNDIAKEYQPMAENSPRIQKAVNQYLKQEAIPKDSDALNHYNSMTDNDPNKAALGTILQRKGLL